MFLIIFNYFYFCRIYRKHLNRDSINSVDMIWMRPQIVGTLPSVIRGATLIVNDRELAFILYGTRLPT